MTHNEMTEGQRREEGRGTRSATKLNSSKLMPSGLSTYAQTAEHPSRQPTTRGLKRREESEQGTVSWMSVSQARWGSRAEGGRERD